MRKLVNAVSWWLWAQTLLIAAGMLAMLAVVGGLWWLILMTGRVMGL